MVRNQRRAAQLPAEWIVERTQINGKFPPPPDYHSVALSLSTYETTGSLTLKNITDGKGQPSVMYGTSNELASVGSLDKDYFRATWHHFT